MNTEIARGLMEQSIQVALQSKPEDDRLHPKVGAVLADDTGRVHLTAYRGQAGKGGHAEFSLLEEATRLGLPLHDKTLFVTLEPCSRRSPEKSPCAVRVANSGIRTVYVGTLDPNPQIIGRGVNFLVESGVTVEHFPADLRKKLIDINATFIGQHSYLVDPIVSPPDDVVEGRQRHGILTTTLEMIATTKGEVRIFSGDSSWLQDLFVGLLEARLDGHPIRMIAQSPLTDDQYAHLAAIGIEVADAPRDLGLRATMTMRGGQPKSLVVIERDPARHAQLFSEPHDNAVLHTFMRVFDDSWDQSTVRGTASPSLKRIPLADVAAALRMGVVQYCSAEIAIQRLAITDLHFLTNDVEILKMRRAAATIRIMEKHDLAAPLSIAGTPWAFFPPIMERDLSGCIVVVDGVHRVYDAIRRGATSIDAIIVDGVDAPLPARAVQGFEPNILARKRERRDRYVDYDERAFRAIRQALGRGGWTPSDLG